jgi:hypothetical protein
MMRGRSKHEARCCQPEKRGGRNFCSGRVIAITVAIMGPCLRESNIFHRRIEAAEK